MERLFEIREGTCPSIPGLMLATIRALKSLGGSGTIQEILEKVIEQERVPEDEQKLLLKENGPTRLQYYLAWARTYLKRGGALENSSRGVWALTDIGEKISSLEEVRRIYEKVNEEERERQRKKREQSQKGDECSEDSSGFQKSDGFDDGADDEWKQELLKTLHSMSPAAFERLAQRLLREAGFVKVEVLGKSQDGGIDGVGILRVGLISFHVYFQCKRWNGNSVTSKDIRDFRGALQGRGDKGIFITTSHFTSNAQKEATRDGAIAIDLVDGDRLCDLLKEYGLGVHVETVQRVTINSEWYEQV